MGTVENYWSAIEQVSSDIAPNVGAITVCLLVRNYVVLSANKYPKSKAIKVNDSLMRFIAFAD
jgi:hypothetical protein